MRNFSEIKVRLVLVLARESRPRTKSRPGRTSPVLGICSSPKGPDALLLRAFWGWRIDIRPGEETQLQLQKMDTLSEVPC